MNPQKASLKQNLQRSSQTSSESVEARLIHESRASRLVDPTAIMEHQQQQNHEVTSQPDQSTSTLPLANSLLNVFNTHHDAREVTDLEPTPLEVLSQSQEQSNNINFRDLPFVFSHAPPHPQEMSAINWFDNVSVAPTSLDSSIPGDNFSGNLGSFYTIGDDSKVPGKLALGLDQPFEPMPSKDTSSSAGAAVRVQKNSSDNTNIKLTVNKPMESQRQERHTADRSNVQERDVFTNSPDSYGSEVQQG